MSSELNPSQSRSYPQYCQEINCPYYFPEHFRALPLCTKSKEEIDPNRDFKCPLDNLDNIIRG